MGCQILFGSFQHHSGSIDYVLEVPDYVLFGGFDTTYNEWIPVPDMAQQVRYVTLRYFTYYVIFIYLSSQEKHRTCV